MYRANIQRTGIYQTKGLRNLTGIKWKLQINSEPETTGLQVGFYYPLAIKDGVVYLCNKGYLYAIYSETGEEIWKIQIDNAILDNLILYKNIVCVSSSNGSLYAVNVETQQIKWKSPINFIRHCNPVIYDDVIFANSTDGNLYALYTEDGREKWRFKTTKDMSVTPPALSNGIIYIASENGNVYAIDAKSGQEKWKCEVGKLRWLFSVPVVANNVVYIGINNSILYAIDAEAGTKIWQSQVEATYYISSLCPLVVNDELIYIGVGIGSLCAINIKSQEKSWQKLGRAIQRINSISLADGIIYCERDGAINAIEAKSGDELWEFAAPEPKWWILKPNLWPTLILNSFSKRLAGSSTIRFSSPVIADGVVYTLCGNGYLYALH
jgi:outer membrane protein assembly factor BamB